MKAMEKDRDRRYETANGLAADIRRYLENEPVVASPPSATYRMRKFVRRNRAGVSTTVIAAGLLVAFAITMAVQAKRIATERDRANREREISDEVVDFQARMLRSIEPMDMGHGLATDLRGRVIEAQGDDAGEMAVADLATFDRLLDSVSMTDAARQVIDASILTPASAAITERFGDDPATEARLRHAVARTYRHLGMPAKAMPEFERSYELREQLLGPDHRDTLEAYSLIGDMHERLGRYDVAEGMFREGVKRWEAAFGRQDDNTLDAYLMLAVNGLGNERDDEARDLLEMVLTERDAADADPADIASTASNLATAYINLRQFEEAEPLLERVLDIYAELDDLDVSTVAMAKDRLARMRSYQKRHDEAIAIMQEVVEMCRRECGALHPRTLRNLNRLARTYERADRHQESLDVHRESLRLQREVLGDRHPSTQTAITDVGIAMSRLGHHQEALPLHEEVLQISRETFGSEHPLTADRMGNLAVCYWYLGRMEECAELFREAYELGRRLLGERDPAVAHQAENLGIVYTAIGRLDEAEAMLKDAYEVHVAVTGPDGMEALRTRSTIAHIQFERGDTATALATYEEIVPKLTEVGGAANQQTVEAVYNLCLAYRASDRNEDAEPLLSQYVEICGETLGTDHDQTMIFVQELAALYIDTDRAEQARPLVEGIVATRTAAAAKPDASAKELHDCALILLEAEPIDLRDPASALDLASRASDGGRPPAGGHRGAARRIPRGLMIAHADGEETGSGLISGHE
jgi:non-specific serine/threonine protein kinase/serine/threonine-protein kinase